MIKVSAVFACTVCDSETGAQVRAAIFDENFWGTLVRVAAPFPVLLIGLAIYHFGMPSRGADQKGSELTLNR